MRGLNAREVLFAQEIVKGATGRDAYKAAGYKITNDNTTDVCASQLLRRPKVAAYIQELQGRAASRAEISAAYLTEKVLALAKSAEDIPQNPAAIQAALASYMGAAKLNGLIIDRTIHERKDTGDLTRAELMDLIRQRRGSGAGNAQANGRGREPDQLHGILVRQISHG
jgi:phage terminase small subunit